MIMLSYSHTVNRDRHYGFRGRSGFAVLVSSSSSTEEPGIPRYEAHWRPRKRLLRDAAGLLAISGAAQANRFWRHACSPLQRNFRPRLPVVAFAAAPDALHRHLVADRVHLEHRTGIDINAEAEGKICAGGNVAEVRRVPVRDGCIAGQGGFAGVFDRELERLWGGRGGGGARACDNDGNKSEVRSHI